MKLQLLTLRQGSHFPTFSEPRRAAENALTSLTQEAYVQGTFMHSVNLQQTTNPALVAWEP